MSNASKNIMVSVSMLAYNHGRYIEKAIKSVLMQRVNFDYELVIAEDCSTDNTREIIEEYCAKYPNIIKPIYQKNNIGALENAAILRNNCKGKYIAVLEGDDFWNDENKLQKQIDFLEKNPDFSAVGANAYIVDKNGNVYKNNPLVNDFRIVGEDTVYTSKDLGSHLVFCHTATLVYRNWFIGMDKEEKLTFDKCKSPGDMKIAALCSAFGKICVFNNYMASYRFVIAPDSGGASSELIKKNINIPYMQFCSTKNIRQFIKQYFDVDLDYSEFYCKAFNHVLKGLFHRKKNCTLKQLFDIFFNIPQKCKIVKRFYSRRKLYGKGK